MEYLGYTADVLVILVAIRAFFLMAQISIYYERQHNELVRKMFGA